MASTDMVVLKKGNLRERLFYEEPRLKRLDRAIEVAHFEWARSRIHDRALHQASTQTQAERNGRSIPTSITDSLAQHGYKGAEPRYVRTAA